VPEKSGQSAYPWEIVIFAALPCHIEGSTTFPFGISAVPRGVLKKDSIGVSPRSFDFRPPLGDFLCIGLFMLRWW
jgi:hypothetical protein